MKTLYYLAFINLALTIGQFAFGATLTSQIDACCSSGTSVNNELPPFRIAPTGGAFGIRNNSAAGAPQ